jgi:hypothetical protein
MKLDTKSLLIGLTAGVLVMLAVGAGNPADTNRYQITAAGSPPIAFVLDTQTGRVWGRGFASTAQFPNDAGFSEVKNEK